MDVPLTLPNFIYFGMPKSGSATITELLKRHPQAYCPRAKELNFFNRDAEHAKGIPWYQAQYFSGRSTETIVCDNSIGYASGNYRKTAARIRAALGSDVRLLLTLRHPAERAYSQYCMARYKGGFETLEFPDALATAFAVEGDYGEDELRGIETGGHYSSARDMAIFRHAMYLVPGRYADIVTTLWELFGSDNLLVLFTEDIAGNLPAEFRKITDFLGIDPMVVPPNLRSNEASALRYPWLKRMYNSAYSIPFVRHAVGSMTPAGKKLARKYLMAWNYRKNRSLPAAPEESMRCLQAYYADQVADLGRLLGRDMTGWTSQRGSGNRRQ